MRQNKRSAESNDAQDSFLDVIANVVGVLIILVMLVGVRASHRLIVAEADPELPSTEVQHADFLQSDIKLDLASLKEQLSLAKKNLFAEEAALKQTATHILRINHETVQQDQHRNELAMHRALIEEDLEKRRKQLDDERQSQFDIQRQLVESQIQLDELTKEQLSLAAAPSTVEEVECVPTPLAKTVDGPAIHLRIKNGLVSVVPLEELLQEVDYRVPEIRRRLQTRSRVVETIGPLDGYRLKFTVAKRITDGAVTGPLVGQRQRVVLQQYAQILPTTENIGQNVEQALMPGATLHKLLHAKQRENPPIVVWLYTDSFDQFRPLKRKLWEMGFSLATRPLRPGTHIGASPNGTKSAAQ